MDIFPYCSGKSFSRLSNDLSKVKPLKRICMAFLSAAFLASGAAAFEETEAEAKIRLETQRAEYDAIASKTVKELQQFRRADKAVLKTGETVTLTFLNPNVNAWLLLEIESKNKKKKKTFHIENADPVGQKITLDLEPKPHLAITSEIGTYRCVPWSGRPSRLQKASDGQLPFSPICGARIYLRNKVKGSRTNLEATSEFMRDNVWMGESLVGFVKDAFFKDAHLETAEEIEAEIGGLKPVGLERADLEKTPVVATRIGLNLTGVKRGQMTMGSWYPVADLPGVFSTTIQPRVISQELLRDKGSANRLDSKESRAQVYLVAFDMTQFELGYELGTQHPRLNWSPRPHGAGRNWNIPGPDGINSPAPLVNLGMVNPSVAKRIVATFTGGYKRQHAAFRYGDYATVNHGTHYGFIVHGVVESKLQPNLSTLFVLDDGTIQMKTWTLEDNKLLPRIRFARQNGVPLVERDSESGKSMPGPRVPQWGPGNWSGSAEAELRTLRAGACMRRAEGKQFLIYGYFSTATPSAMARTFQSLSCDYAMLLDMNALEHTYLAVYVRKQGALQAQHLVRGMAAIDKKQRDGKVIPRFVGFSDNRDFFYLSRKKEQR